MPSKKSAKPSPAPRTPQIWDQWEVVIVPFPFSSSQETNAARRWS